VPEPKRSETRHEPIRIGLLGASFGTGNMGVSALAESTIKCILHRWPDAEVTLLDSGRAVGEHRLRIGDKDLCIKELPIRFCKNVFLESHFIVLFSYALLLKVFRWDGFRRFCTRRNASLRCIAEIDMVADITGGDSFSDIYGMRRFVLGFLRKWLVLLFNKDLIMLPQTYGPFKRPLTRVMARYILKKASLVYSRDRAGVEYVNKLLNDEPSADIRVQNSIVVGLNVSGLLFNGGYSRNNMFGLRTDYRELICEIVEMLLKDEKVTVLLIPHVFPPPGYEVESDSDACLKIYEQLSQTYPDRVFLVKGEYDQGEIKYIIGLCDFFIGSRMHSCIAALSQNIPMVGLAYSKKFSGVFDSVGVGNWAIDLRTATEPEVLSRVEDTFINGHKMTQELSVRVAQVQREVLSILYEAL
jgi:polysaccharide pyruvyl transferase WcaK-like protein